MKQPNEIDVKNLLIERLRDVPIWDSFCQAMNDTMIPEIHEPIKELMQSRIVNQVSLERAVENTKILGFTVGQQSFTIEEHARINEHLGGYLQTKGASKQFINFLGIVKNSKIEYAELWTTDYKVFSEHPGLPLWQGGQWYPTVYFNVYYNLEEILNLDEPEFISFIYQLAPIHLVMKIFYGYITTTTNLYITPVGDFERSSFLAIANEIHSANLYTTPLPYIERTSFVTLNSNGFILLQTDDGSNILLDDGNYLNNI